MVNNAAVILEGGAVRGVFSSGVLDYLMEQECYFKYVYGVSAGSCNAVDFVSRQPGRTRDCIIRSKEDGSLISFRNAIRNKSIFDMDLLFEKDPEGSHPFDYDTFFHSRSRCEIVLTNCLTGKAEYKTENQDKKRLMQLLRASCSIPLGSPMVFIDGVPYLDGGIADSIPLIHSMKSGNKKNVVVLTRNKGYRKTISRKRMSVYAAVFKKYPKFVEALCLRPYYYNQIVTYIEKWEEEGKVFVIRPQIKPVSRTERDPEVLTEFYRHGYEQMEKQYQDMMEFLKK